MGTLCIASFSTITQSDRVSLVLYFPRTKGPGVSLVNQWLYFNSGKVFNPSFGKHSKLVANGYHHKKNKLFFFFFFLIPSAHLLWANYPVFPEFRSFAIMLILSCVYYFPWFLRSDLGRLS